MNDPKHKTIKVWFSTYRDLKKLAAEKPESLAALIDRLVKVEQARLADYYPPSRRFAEGDRVRWTSPGPDRGKTGTVIEVGDDEMLIDWDNGRRLVHDNPSDQMEPSVATSVAQKSGTSNMPCPDA